MRRVQAHALCRCSDLVGGRHIVRVTAGPSDDIIILALDGAPDYRGKHPSGFTFAKPWADVPNRFHLFHLTATNGPSAPRTAEIALPPTVENAAFVQPLPGGRWLLVRSRARDSGDLNAIIYDGAARQVGAFHAGDGIAAVQATADGRLWVSYFDEGIFGGRRRGPTLGAAGLVQLDAAGTVLFRATDLGDQLLPISDCYALNSASPDETWFVYYTDFPLVRLRGTQLDHQWRNLPLQGTRALAVLGDQILFRGGYQERGRLFLLSLASEQREEIEVWHDGSPLTFAGAFGRGPCLYLMGRSGDLCQLDLRALAPASANS